MKILHVIPSFGLGGMEKVLCSLINGLSKDFFHEILALDNKIEAQRWLENEAVEFLSFKKASTRYQFFWDLYKVIKSSKPHILMTYNWGATDAIWLGRLAGISTIYHSEHGFNVEEAEKRQVKRNVIRFFVYRLTRQVVVVSTQLIEIMQSSFRLQPRQVKFIPNGLDLSFYSPDIATRQKIRKGLGIQDNEILVGFIGRLDPVKNLPLMLNAFESSVTRDRAFKLLLVGEGSERLQVESICRDKKISRHVLLVGQQSDVLPFLRALDVFFLTSLREQMPMSLLEAMAVGIPVVATAVGDIPNMVENGKEGFIIKGKTQDQAGELASALLQLRDFEQRQAMGKASRHKAISCFNKITMLGQYEKLLRGL